MEILVIILLYGLIWGVFHFWGIDRTIGKVISNPDRYSFRKVELCKRLTFLPKVILSFLIALSVPLGLFVILWFLKILGIFIARS